MTKRVVNVIYALGETVVTGGNFHDALRRLGGRVRGIVLGGRVVRRLVGGQQNLIYNMYNAVRREHVGSNHAGTVDRDRVYRHRYVGAFDRRDAAFREVGREHRARHDVVRQDLHKIIFVFRE